MDDSLRQLVRDRANGTCEYCQFPEEYSFYPFQIDHIIAEKHDGPTVEWNLAWSCFYCNTYKGPNISGWDSEKDVIVRLFHPRKDQWVDHFEWNGPILVGKTQIGALTVKVLRINHADGVSVRRAIRDWQDGTT